MPLILICAVFLFSTVAAEDLPPEKIMPEMTVEIDASIRALDQLTAMTERSLAAQRQIRQQMLDYRQIKAQFLQNQQDRELIVRVVKAAYGLQNAIKANHLEDALDSEFMHEIAFFSQIASKKSLPKP
jgi:hypothetical protein